MRQIGPASRSTTQLLPCNVDFSNFPDRRHHARVCTYTYTIYARSKHAEMNRPYGRNCRDSSWKIIVVAIHDGGRFARVSVSTVLRDRHCPHENTIVMPRRGVSLIITVIVVFPSRPSNDIAVSYTVECDGFLFIPYTRSRDERTTTISQRKVACVVV